MAERDPGSASDAVSGFDADLRDKTTRSIGWTITRQVSDQLFSFLVFVILARLLTKEAIGIYAMAYVFAEIGRIIATAGLMQIIARAQIADAKLKDTIFWSNIALAIAYVALVWVTAPWIARWVEQPGLVAPLRVLALALPINALGATHMALRLREFGHKTIALRSLLAGIIGGGAAVVAAFAGAGIWALVIQRCLTEAVGAVLAWTSYRWVPGRAFDWQQARHNLGFGGNLTIAQLIFLMIVRVQDLLIGANLGAAAVGTYRVAWRSNEIFANGAIQPFSSVGLQTYSRLQGNPEGLRQAYQAMLGTCAALSFPALVGFGVLSPEIVPLVFGAKWAEAGALGQIFAFMAVPYTLNYFASPVLTAMGNSRRQRTLAVVQLLSTLLLTWLALPFGLMAVAIAYVARSYLTLPLQIRFLRETSGIRWRDTVVAVRAPFIASTAMGVLLWSALAAMKATGWLAVIAAIALGGLFYLGALALLSRFHRQLAAKLLTRKGLVLP
ncbi:lipopolysaccharide biosynthesis protein [Sphingomonas cavernae]|uniref:Lipopolysaccharide biosynthesis protein n=1 Tax=Sphingomonas cavernae TaxID=2320861 RepID=A0A418W6T5_9SPHN|nr:lipopolysaccharide biosynthesis protein [Sphingomonas cavernae]RJF85765.1 lipopolysaccharide biosynthesis protein [Sphingomonas cavernae]